MTPLLDADPYSDPHPNPILYACVARAAIVLAELSTSPDAGDDLAARCLPAAPPFHLLYSHTSGGRIYSFLFADPFVFFAVADEAAVGQSFLLLLVLRRLHDAFSCSPALRRRDTIDALPRLGLQEAFLPELRRVVLSSFVPRGDGPPRLCPFPPSLNAPLQPCKCDGDRKVEEKKDRKGKDKTMISIGDRESADSDTANGGHLSLQKQWRQRLLKTIIFDVILCCILLVVWVSICRGFQCLSA